MGWDDDLFGVLDDLESQADAAFAAERAPELADRSRAEYQSVTLAARLMASLDDEVTLHVTGVGALHGVLVRVASTWCLLAGAGQNWVVALPALAAVEGASARAMPEVAWPAVARLGLGSALRRLAESGERCVVHRVDGTRHDGVPRRVGADFVEVVEGEHRVTLVAHTAVAAVQSREA